MIERSDSVRANCARYYSERNSCRGCPLTAECWHDVRQPLTQERIDEHTVRLNAAAEALEGPR